MKRKIIAVVVSAAIIAAAVALYFPHNLGAALRFDDSPYINVSVTVFTAANGGPSQDQSSYHYESGTAEFTAINALLKEYSYHFTFISLVNTVRDNLLMTDMTTTILVSGVIGGTEYTGLNLADCSGANAVVNASLGKVGYIGNKTALELCDKIIEICK
ncbi:MAG: hypothetical protein FWF44_07325 [Defluviitaleaceae bacterium]|nr:hypothetical protein [Defluviitaleaceae bacterium]